MECPAYLSRNSLRQALGCLKALLPILLSTDYNTNYYCDNLFYHQAYQKKKELNFH